ncbi:phage tail tape measure protein [Streptomyces coelicoflavus]|uniref:phage tail tape measure protein n=1 Tax=Streptomyces coelicoflavus TaxID=285562 RepID=UPI00364B113A
MPTRTTRVIYDLVARDNASRTFGRVGGAATRLGKQGAGVGAAMAAGLAVGTVAVGGIGFAALSASGQFEKSMNQVRAVSGATGKDFQDLRNQAKELGATTKFTASEAADGMGFLAMAGFKAHDILNAMPGVLSLASAGNLDLARSADIASNILTGYGFKTAQTTRVVDVMAKTFTSTNTNMEQLGEAFKYAGPVAHAAGVKFEETAAAIGLMGNAGIQASMAGTALRGAVTRLLSPTAKVAKILKKLGVDATDSSGKLRPLNEIIRQLEKSGATTGEMMTIFGQRAGPALLALVDQGSGSLVKLTKELEHSGGTADRIAKIQMEGLKGQLVSLKSAWEGLMIEIGDLGVLDLATGAVEGLTTSTRNFTGFVDKYAKPAAKSFRDQMSDLVPVDAIKTKFGQAKSAVGDFIGGLTGSKSTAKGLLGALFDNAPHLGSGKAGGGAKGPALTALPHYGAGQVAPVTGVQGPALKPLPHGGSGSAAPLTMPEVKPPKSMAQKIGESIRKAISGGIENLDWGKLGSGLGKGLSTAIGWVGKNTAELTKKFGSILAGIDWVDVGKAVGGQAIPFAIGFIVNLFAPLFSLDFWKEHWLDAIIAVLSVIPIGRIFGALGKLIGKIPFLRIFEPLFSGIGKLGGLIEKGLGKIFGPIGRGIAGGFKKAFPAAEGIAKSLLEKLILAPARKVGTFAKLIPRGLATGLENGTAWVTEKALNVGKAVVKPFAKAGSWLWSKGTEFVKGLGRGIVAGVKGFGTWVWTTVGRPVVDAFRTAGSALLTKGRSFVSGLKSGIVAGAKGVGGWAWRTVGKPVVDAFKAAGSWLVSKGKAYVSGLKSGIVAGVKAIGGWVVRTVITPIVSRFSTAGSWLVSKGKATVSGLKSGVLAGAKAIASWVGSHVVSPVVGRFSKAGSWLYSKGSSIISGLKNGIVKGVKGVGSWIKKHVVDPIVSAVKKFFGINSPSKVFAGIGGHLVSGLVKGLAQTNGTAIAKKVFGDMPHALGAIVSKGLVAIGSLPSKAMTALSGLGSEFNKILSKLFGGGGGGGTGVSKWSPLVSQVLAMLGAPGTALPAVLKRIEMESGGNPNAINLTDSNAKAGHPSQGLMQTIPSTFNAYAGPFRSRGITDPLANIYAGINYAMHRYGSNWISVMTRPGGYDSGGLARGLGFLPKYTPKPERVLSPRQTASFEQLVDLLARGGLGPGGGQFTGQLVLDSGELVGVIQGSVQPMIKASEQRQAHRARVGRRTP